MTKRTLNGCKLFNCDKMHGNYCCAKCKNVEKCKNHCLNDPEKCGANVKLKEKKDIRTAAKKGDKNE